MKIKYMSDLHAEFGLRSSELKSITLGIEDYDILVIAGDIDNCNCANTLKEAAEIIHPRKLIYVCGNHDYYQSSVGKINKNLVKLTKQVENLFVINRKYLAIDRETLEPVDFENSDNAVVFIGATGWQNFETYSQKNFPMMNDFNLIDHHKNNVKKLGNKDYKFLKETLDVFSGRIPIVVITHVVPAIEAVDFKQYEVFSKEHYIRAYYNNWIDLLEDNNIHTWICGHIHDTFKKKINNVNVVRNAHGYINTVRKNTEFKKDMIFEI